MYYESALNVLTKFPVQNHFQYSVPVLSEEKLKLNCYVVVGAKRIVET